MCVGAHLRPYLTDSEIPFALLVPNRDSLVGDVVHRQRRRRPAELLYVDRHVARVVEYDGALNDVLLAAHERRPAHEHWQLTHRVGVEVHDHRAHLIARGGMT